MKTKKNLFGIISIFAIMSLIFITCDNGDKPCSHDWGAWSATTNPTCSATGTGTRNCNLCGTTDTNTTIPINPTAHAPEVHEDCTLAQECQFCDYQFQTGELNHSWGEWYDITKEPNCIETGIGKRDCVRAGCLVTDANTIIPVDLNAHDWDLWITIPGYEIEICKYNGCGVTSGEKNLILEIGDTGTGGGKIFYKSENGFIMTDTGETCHYLEAAPEDLQLSALLRAWSSSDFIPFAFGGTGDEWVFISGTEIEIGTGRNNTALILNIDALAPAALACINYNNAEKIDWFLPSKDELYMLYLNKNIFNNLDMTQYWTSSQYHLIEGAWCLFFNYFLEDYNGGLGNYHKPNQHGIRPIRAF